MNVWERIESAPALEHRARSLGMALMCLVAVAWAGLEFLGSFIPREYSVFQIVWMRYGAHLLFMLIFLSRAQKSQIVHTTRLGSHVCRSLLMLGMPLCFVMALRMGVKPPEIWSIAWISTPMTIVMAAALLSERTSPGHWLCALIGLAGTWLVYRPESIAFRWAWVFPAGMAFCHALYKVLTREMRAEHIYVNLFHTALWVFIPLTLVVPFFWQTPSPKAALAMAGIGVWGLVVLCLLDRALSLAPASLTAPFLQAQCVWSALFLVSVRHFQWSISAVVGSALITGSCVWIFARERLGPPQRQPSAV